MTVQRHYIGYSLTLFHLLLYLHNCNMLDLFLKMTINIFKSFIFQNFLHRLAQIRESGIQDRIFQQHHISNEPTEQPSITDVSLVTVAPLLVILAAGYVIGIFVLLIERCSHGNILKYWPRGTVRRPWLN